MKKYLLLLLAGAPLAVLAQTKGFVITGTVTGLTDKSLVSVTDVNDPTDTLASTTVQNGAFTLKGTIQEANLHQLNFGAVQKKAVLFIGNENITVKGSTENIQNLDVKGSAINSDFMEFQNTFSPLFRQLTEMNQRISSIPNIKRDDSLVVAYMKQIDKIKSTIDKFVANKKSSPVAPFALVVTSEIEDNINATERRFKMLDTTLQQGFYGKILAQRIGDAKIGAVGTDAIEFSQNDTTGKAVALSSFKGKYVLVDFWASWCGPCRMENPNVVNTYKKFKGKNFAILGVSLDKSRDAWIKAINDDGLTWTHVSDLKYWNNDVARTYKIESIPQNFLVDPNGKIIARNLHGATLEAKLCELLGCN
ncbi:MAG: TlpA disulfide reductase family protein [Chitinophagaceae bacterium]